MKAFVISMNTPVGRDRLKRFRQRMDGFEIEVVEGINGKNSVSDQTTAACKLFCTPAMIGTSLSHMECWKRVVQRGLDAALVFEDDAVVVPDFEKKLRRVMLEQSEYDVLLLGCFHCSATLQKLLLVKNQRSTGSLRPVKYFNGSHAYVVTNKGARALLEATQSKAAYHIDFHMSLLPGLKILAVKDDLAFQEDMSTSSIASSANGASFPGTLNTILSTIKTDKNISWNYIFNVPICRIGPVTITLWSFIFISLGALTGRSATWSFLEWALVLAALDMLLVPPHNPSDVVSKAGLFLGGHLFMKQN